MVTFVNKFPSERNRMVLCCADNASIQISQKVASITHSIANVD